MPALREVVSLFEDECGLGGGMPGMPAVRAPAGGVAGDGDTGTGAGEFPFGRVVRGGRVFVVVLVSDWDGDRGGIDRGGLAADESMAMLELRRAGNAGSNAMSRVPGGVWRMISQSSAVAQ